MSLFAKGELLHRRLWSLTVGKGPHHNQVVSFLVSCPGYLKCFWFWAIFLVKLTPNVPQWPSTSCLEDSLAHAS